jgi:acyl-CoA synthetase (AMP-forming)/AMP-acid ligase II/3-oxoacyl-(acyl-carrier-protein) synthase/SAM-dependent methyltransferase/acyl carrier protein
VASASVARLLADAAGAQPAKTAFVFLADGERESGRLTYAALDGASRRIAGRLRAAGLAAGDRALILCPSGLEYIAAYFGCAYAGVIAVPAYAPGARRLARIDGIAADCDARAYLAPAAERARVAGVLEKSVHLRDAAFVDADCCDEGPGCGPASACAAPDATAHLQYTSGSTGMPKGVVVSHANILENCGQLARVFRHTADTVFVSWLPPFHDMGLVLGILDTVYVGGTGVLMPPAAFMQDALRWVKAVSRYRGTSSAGPDFSYGLCARRASSAVGLELDLSSWATAVNGAETVRAETLDRFAATFGPYGFRREAFAPAYGMAESTLIISGTSPGTGYREMSVDRDALVATGTVEVAGPAGRVVRIVSCGEPAGCAVEIVDPASLAPCAPNRVGEVWVSGDSVARGYWQRPAETREAFGALIPGSDQRYLRTGDLGFVHDGEVFVSGRLKDLIIVRGANHHPEDIEHTVAECHDEFRSGRTVAFSVEREGAEQLVVVQEVRRGAADDADHLARTARESVSLGHGIALHEFVLVRRGSIPVTTSGKVRRRACRDAVERGELEPLARRTWPVAEDPACSPIREGAPGETSGALRDRLLHVASRVLHVPPECIDPAQPLSQYGLDSLAAVALAGEFATLIGTEFPETLLFDHPTLDAIVEYSTGAKSTPAPGPRRAQGDEEIAIVGMGCRLPGARGPDAFWALLELGAETVSAGPPGARSSGELAGVWGAYLAETGAFEPERHHISPREAARMDPQQKLLLDVVGEAVSDTGMAVDDLRGTRTGVFVGISGLDHAAATLGSGRDVDIYSVTGSALSIAANRISYVLDLRGPSIAVDTACSSSLVALHLAVESLRRGECDAAIVGGVNVIASGRITAALSAAGMLAPDGRCKTFDSRADGYVRGEGCGVVLLRRVSDALARGERVRAAILASSANHDGRSQGLTAPSGPAQEAVIADALGRAGVEPRDIAYVETHGTGTALGDPIEVAALDRVLGSGRADGRPCVLGAVKTNIGHLEAAAGIAGLIKVVLSLEHGTIPANRHFAELNPRIRPERVRFVFPTAPVPWRPGGQGGRRTAGVSSFGFGGTNAHVVVADGALPRADDARDGSRSAAAVESAVDAAASLLGAEQVAHIDTQMRALDALALRFMGAAVAEVAHARPAGGAGVDLGPPPHLARITATWRGHLAAAGLLEDVGDGDLRRAEGRIAIDVARNAVREAFGVEAPIVRLVERCGAALADVLAGRVDPLELVFPGGEVDELAWIYGEYALARIPNAAIAAAVASILAGRCEGGPPRIIEIGAGTGATTRAVLSALGDHPSYTFTDVGEAFVHAARKRYASESRVECSVLDIERSPAEQGFVEGQYDVVIAANVIHATSDIMRSLGHMRRLLCPGGFLVLWESTESRPWQAITFGLLPGWHSHADDRAEGAGPLIATREWKSRLSRTGFCRTASVFGHRKDWSFGQDVIIAQRPEGAAARDHASAPDPRGPESETPGDRTLHELEWVPSAVTGTLGQLTDIAGTHWIVFLDSRQTIAPLVDVLRAQGARVVVASAGESFEHASDSFRLRRAAGEDFRRMMRAAAPISGAAFRGVVYAWALDSGSGRDAASGEVDAAVSLSCTGLVHAIREYTRAPTGAAARSIWVITEGAQALPKCDLPLNPFQAWPGAWGARRRESIRGSGAA